MVDCLLPLSHLNPPPPRVGIMISQYEGLGWLDGATHVALSLRGTHPLVGEWEKTFDRGF